MSIAIVLSILGAVLFSGNALVAGFFLGVGGSALVALLDIAPSNKYHQKLIWQVLRHPKSPIRVSISYLFRIRVSGRYLLIRGTRFPDQFQPIGGVYKLFPSGVARLKSSFGAVDDDIIPID